MGRKISPEMRQALIDEARKKSRGLISKGINPHTRKLCGKILNEDGPPPLSEGFWPKPKHGIKIEINQKTAS